MPDEPLRNAALSERRVYCTHQWPGMHRWPEAPDDVAFLRHRHRHQFSTRVEVRVEHDDRDVEFIRLKRCVSAFIEARFAGDNDAASCEHMARRIAAHLDAKGYSVARVVVSEDGENGADLRFRPRTSKPADD